MGARGMGARLDACHSQPFADGGANAQTGIRRQPGDAAVPSAAPIWVRSLEKSMGFG
ncbi:hypothetical protein AIGOOFII_1669 [Methylobacterium marchantiae]|nr:hypothetical protein AIGOOFII_1669 [Methylobacterium marchantiae]